MKNLKIRKYCKGDEKGFLALDRKLEEHKYNRRSISNFLWKYKSKNFFGKSVNYFLLRGRLLCQIVNAAGSGFVTFQS